MTYYQGLISMDKKINPSPITYLNSGVDIDAGNTLVEAITAHAKRTNTKEAEQSLEVLEAFLI